MATIRQAACSSDLAEIRPLFEEHAPARRGSRSSYGLLESFAVPAFAAP
jgi:hypothetical protein